MEDIKKRNLTIRLSRLTTQEASTYSSKSGTGRPKSMQIDLSRISHHRPTLPKHKKKRGMTTSGSGFKSSPVKIKLNFFKRRPRRTVDTSSKFAEEKVEIKSDNNAVSSSSTTTASVVKSAVDGETSETKASEPEPTSSSDVEDTEDKDDSSWADEYEYRPRRAAAAAALEAVQGKKKADNGDHDLNKFRLRSKFPMKQPVPKGRSRRTVWKRTAVQKALQFRQKPRVTTCKSLFHDDIFFQRGDIVSLVGEDEETYFCQIGGLLIDQFNKSFASLSWLSPKANVPCQPFAAHNYTIRDELQPIMADMNDVLFVMHCPHDYYYDHDVNYMKLNPDGETVYQRLGDPLVIVEDQPIDDANSAAGQSTDDNLEALPVGICI